MISPYIKQIIEGYLNYVVLPDVEIGEVVSLEPLGIRIASFPEPLGKEFVIMPERLTKDTYTVETSTGKTTVKVEGLKLVPGDKVSMVKAKGGQTYLVIDKVV